MTGTVQQQRAPSDAIAAAVLIGLDWGTTSLRAYLFDAAGAVLDERESEAGVMNLPGGPAAFGAAFEAVCGAWLASRPQLPVIAAGMIGSDQGWVPAPYVSVPADAAALAHGLVRMRTPNGAPLAIVPGVLEAGALPNVMRGEETQVVGALGDGIETMLIGLPGTHAKWVLAEGGRIEHFYTFMTGEIYAALCKHTILGRTMTAGAPFDAGAFLHGVGVAREHAAAGLLATAFSARTLGLTGQLDAARQADYLSGVLIGHELAGLDALFAARGQRLAARPLRLIGSAPLCERYRLALAPFGCADVHIVHRATERGLWQVACRAGLIDAEGAAEPAARSAIQPLVQP